MRRLAKKYRLRLFVETGTYRGTTLAALRKEFDRLYSIELGEELFQEARKRFQEEPRIELINGDSAVELPRLLARLHEPALVWLDGHYSGGSTAKGHKETPIVEEVMALAACGEKHVIVIDDARCFGSLPDYPALEDFRQLLRRSWPSAQLLEEADMIMVLPKRE